MPITRTFRYQDPSGSYTITEDQIIAIYWERWVNQMRRAGKADQISKEHCIEDFVTIHWAWEVKP